MRYRTSGDVDKIACFRNTAYLLETARLSDVGEMQWTDVGSNGEMDVTWFNINLLKRFGDPRLWTRTLYAYPVNFEAKDHIRVAYESDVFVDVFTHPNKAMAQMRGVQGCGDGRAACVAK